MRAPENRWYDDACGAAHGLELLGERWALLVVRELMFGPRRFGEVRSGLPGIRANVLTQRLAGLEAAGVLTRRHLPSPANAQVYELTSWGYETEPIFQTLGRWAARSPQHDPSLPLSAASLLLSFGTMLDPGRAGDRDATIDLQLADQCFCVRLREGRLTVLRAPLGDGDAIFVTDPRTMASVVYGGRPLADAEASGTLTVTGSRTTAKRFVTLFRLPPKAPGG